MLVSLEPGVAVVVGAILLGDSIGLQGLVAIACVVVAAIGMTLFERRSEEST